MALNVPTSYHRGFRELGELTPSEFESLVAALSRHEPRLFSSSSELLDGPVEGADEQVVGRIVDAFVSLALGATDEIERSPSEAAAAVASQISGPAREPLSSDLVESIRRRVETVTQIDPFRVSIRALSLALANGRNFISGRVVTDLRPVFNSSKSVDLANLLVLHRLQIHCTSADTRHEELIVTLDSSDLIALADQLNRAVEKEQALKKLLQETNLHFLTSSGSGKG